MRNSIIIPSWVGYLILYIGSIYLLILAPLAILVGHSLHYLGGGLIAPSFLIEFIGYGQNSSAVIEGFASGLAVPIISGVIIIAGLICVLNSFLINRKGNMICTKCGINYESGKKFCSRCGEPLSSKIAQFRWIYYLLIVLFAIFGGYFAAVPFEALQSPRGDIFIQNPGHAFRISYGLAVGLLTAIIVVGIPELISTLKTKL